MPIRDIPKRIVRRSSSSFSSSDESRHDVKNNSSDKLTTTTADALLDPPVLVYHSNARSIVFRDQLRRASLVRSDSALSTGSTSSEHAALHHHHHHHRDITSSPPPSPIAAAVARKQVSPKPSKKASSPPRIQPFAPLELGPNQEFLSLLNHNNTTSTTRAEQDVVQRLQDQTAVVKTIKNCEWATFLQRFLHSESNVRGRSPQHQDQMHGIFNSFVTSTSLLPSNGLKMRCYGSTIQYTTGVVFALPTQLDNDEDKEVERTETWAWPAGYAAKVRYNGGGYLD